MTVVHVMMTGAHPAHGLKHLLLVTVHLCERSDLRQVDVLAVSKGNNLVKGKDEVKGILLHILLIQRMTILRNLRGGGERALSVSEGGREGREGGMGLTTREKSRSVSKSSRILLVLVVMSSMNSRSRGW